MDIGIILYVLGAIIVWCVNSQPFCDGSGEDTGFLAFKSVFWGPLTLGLIIVAIYYRATGKLLYGGKRQS